MQKLFCLGAFLLLTNLSMAQDFLSVPSANPSLFKTEAKLSLAKSVNIQDSLVYQFDTLQLPFVDDFTKDNFPTLVTDPLTDPRVQDTLFYAIRELNSDVYRGIGFLSDTTYTYTIDTASLSGDTVGQTLNTPTTILFYLIDDFPVQFALTTVFPPYTIFDTISGGQDTLELTPDVIQDSIRYYVVDRDTSAFYADRFVHLNNTLGFYPPTIGVVSFDGLDERGVPYNFNDITSSGRADFLTSNPIDLQNTSDSTYFSFFYQAKGFALDGPDQEDSLTLEFFNDSTKKWGLIWQTQGTSSSAAPDSFKQVIIRVEPRFRRSAFQFRFRSRANLTGAFDHWHLDYLYLDDNRSVNDTAQKDLAFVYPANSFLKDYTAMPVWHFNTDPNNYIADSVELLVRNNFDDPLNVFNKIIVDDPNTGNALFTFPGLNSFLGISAFDALDLPYPLNFTYPTLNEDSFRVISEPCDVDFRPSQFEEKDFIPANDTTYTEAILNNFYAYDDGSAEAAYGINAGSQGATKSYLAVRYDMPFEDTLGGVKIYFLPQENDVRTQNFKLTVWSSLSPPEIVFQKEINDRVFYGPRDGFVTYWFDSLVVAGPTFYVGYEKVGPLSMNVGYDFNRNHRDKISWSLNGVNWFFPSNSIFDGSVMIRPILRKKGFGVGVSEFKAKKESTQLKVYPNPAQNEFFLKEIPEGVNRLQLFSMDGRLLEEYRLDRSRYSLDRLPEGIYLLKGQNAQGRVFTAKIIRRN